MLQTCVEEWKRLLEKGQEKPLVRLLESLPFVIQQSYIPSHQLSSLEIEWMERYVAIRKTRPMLHTLIPLVSSSLALSRDKRLVSCLCRALTEVCFGHLPSKMMALEYNCVPQLLDCYHYYKQHSLLTPRMTSCLFESINMILSLPQVFYHHPMTTTRHHHLIQSFSDLVYKHAQQWTLEDTLINPVLEYYSIQHHSIQPTCHVLLLCLYICTTQSPTPSVVQSCLLCASSLLQLVPQCITVIPRTTRHVWVGELNTLYHTIVQQKWNTTLWALVRSVIMTLHSSPSLSSLHVSPIMMDSTSCSLLHRIQRDTTTSIMTINDPFDTVFNRETRVQGQEHGESSHVGSTTRHTGEMKWKQSTLLHHFKQPKIVEKMMHIDDSMIQLPF